MFSYTSGTTGVPKGVEVTQKMITAESQCLSTRLTASLKGFDKNDRYISYLPMAHIFEQALFSMSLWYGM